MNSKVVFRDLEELAQDCELTNNRDFYLVICLEYVKEICII